MNHRRLTAGPSLWIQTLCDHQQDEKFISLANPRSRGPCQQQRPYPNHNGVSAGKTCAMGVVAPRRHVP